ncbi:saccharopine dehydrogenase C-terminal domain-containing protein [Streptomyces capoamus]|uniref:saccharopine dehydrogenase C-terminal domain-containing protein n=1 Tax=Streptomyces capoamus TaxID=68183 RepID=UPI003396A082
MTGRVPASGTVHWIGAGLSTGSGLAGLCRTAGRVLLWHRTEDRAAEALAGLGLTGLAEPRALAPGALGAALEPGDAVVSMLPAPEHAGLLAACVRAGAHFACSSYASPELLAHAEAARAAGVVVLTESGLDPGIDHLFAHSLIGRARARIGEHTPAAYRLHSYCGGVPAVPDDFRYRFSWAPLGVLNALRTPARYLEDGAEVTAGRPWEATRPLRLGGETFEAYPNRDSVPFLAQYGLPAAWTPRTFVRGTLRPDGWLRAWQPVFRELTAGDDERIAALARELAAAHPATEADRDRVVLSVSLEVDTGGGRPWTGAYLLDTTGDAEESAMARSVSRPLAVGVRHILDGSLPAGLHRAAGTGRRADRWLTELAGEGMEFSLVLGQ